MSEVEQMADRAWGALMQRTDVEQGGVIVEPMPHHVAIDMVQDVTGDRDDAAGEIILAGGRWLANQTQPGGGTAIDQACAPFAGLLIEALVSLNHIRGALSLAREPWMPPDEKSAAGRWELWLSKANRAVTICRAVADAAWPVDPAEPTASQEGARA